MLSLLNPASWISGASAINTNLMNKKMVEDTNKAQAELLQYQNEYNSAEAQKQRDWEESMSSTAYQRARKDMEAAGINPILLGGNAEAASTPTGYAASSSASHSQHTYPIVNVLQNAINTGQNEQKVMNDTVDSVVNAISKFAGA